MIFLFHFPFRSNNFSFYSLKYLIEAWSVFIYFLNHSYFPLLNSLNFKMKKYQYFPFFFINSSIFSLINLFNFSDCFSLYLLYYPYLNFTIKKMKSVRSFFYFMKAIFYIFHSFKGFFLIKMKHMAFIKLFISFTFWIILFIFSIILFHKLIRCQLWYC